MWPSLFCGDIVLLPKITFLVIRVWGSRHNEAKCWFLWFTETLHRHNSFYTVQTVRAIALHLNLALTGDGAFLLSPQKTHSVWFISVLNYGETENVLINHLLIVIHMSYPCHYTNLCPHKPHKHTHTHTHTHTHAWMLLASRCLRCVPTCSLWAGTRVAMGSCLI